MRIFLLFQSILFFSGSVYGQTVSTVNSDLTVDIPVLKLGTTHYHVALQPIGTNWQVVSATEIPESGSVSAIYENNQLSLLCVTYEGLGYHVTMGLVADQGSATVLEVLTASDNPGCNNGVHSILVNTDGSFSPNQTYINAGEKIEWRFSSREDFIVPVANNTDFADAQACHAYLPFNANNPNDFTGPLTEAIPGIFALGPQERGFEVALSDNGDNLACQPAAASVDQNQFATQGGEYLCESGEFGKMMDSTFENPDITGVFIRIPWKHIQVGPNEFDWETFDGEVQKAIDNGKMFSIGFKAGKDGTPDWIFDEQTSGSFLPAKRLTFQDSADGVELGSCGVVMDLASPMDENYKAMYFNFLRVAAAHIKEKNAWFRNLAYVKHSGANLFSQENRLPNSCSADCEICNTQVWAEQGGYTPQGLYQFYTEQSAVIAEAFPGKSMAYMLIQAGFPQVEGPDRWLGKQGMSAMDELLLPGGTEQTEAILAAGQSEQSYKFVVQHNGLTVKPQFVGKAACLNEGLHPAVGPYSESGSNCPNRWVLRGGVQGQVTAFQTKNAKGVANPADVDWTLINQRDNSDGIFIELYEQRIWEADKQAIGTGRLLSDNGSGLSMKEWDSFFHERRSQNFDKTIGLAFPDTYRFTLTHNQSSTSAPQDFTYINPYRCGSSAEPRYGVITILP